MENEKRYETYGEFWTFYVSAHSLKGTQWAHFIGTLAAVAFASYCISQQQWWGLGVALVIGYGPAWVSHFFYEGNMPATFKYPLWSFISDFRMGVCLMKGTMGQEVERAMKQYGSSD